MKKFGKKILSILALLLTLSFGLTLATVGIAPLSTGPPGGVGGG
ncbi:MAG: hypothetical protein ACTSWY_04520 [Promethearchaeota archaeon]